MTVEWWDCDWAARWAVSTAFDSVDCWGDNWVDQSAALKVVGKAASSAFHLAAEKAGWRAFLKADWRECKSAGHWALPWAELKASLSAEQRAVRTVVQKAEPWAAS